MLALPVVPAPASPAAPSADARDAALAREGWVRRFVSPPGRAAEHVELYASLGHEVRLEPVLADELAPECAGCALALGLYRVIYTRRRT